MQIHSVTRARFNKNGSVAHGHTLNFDTRAKARENVKIMKQLDTFNKIKFDWKYKTTSAHIY